MRIALRFVAALLGAGVIESFASTNGLDASFGTGGVVTIGPTPTSGRYIGIIYALAQQTDGKIIVAARASDPGSPTFVPAIGRLNSDGSWDTTFANDGLFVLSAGAASLPTGGQLDHVSLFSDGSILASGGSYDGFGPTNFYGCTLLIKLTSSGTLDTNFAPDDSGSFCFAFALPQHDTFFHFDGLAIDSDDTFYLTTPETNRDSGAVAHFDQNGVLIPTFGDFGIASLPGLYANLLQLLPDRSPVVAGVAYSGPSQPYGVGSAHLDVDGNLDTTYGIGGLFINPSTATIGVAPTWAALDSQDRLLVSDNDFYDPPTYASYRLVRVTAGGAIDTAFNANGQQPGYPGFAQLVVSGDMSTDYLVSAQPLADGHIFAVGNAGYVAAGDGATDLALLRLNDDAGYDMSFGDSNHPGWASLNIGATSSSNTSAQAITVDSSGRVLIVALVQGDISGHLCPALIRVIPDRVFTGDFDAQVAFPACP